MSFGFRREKTDVRRQQIVEVTLALLADTPLDQLSTRQIARELGTSQPALFRHFASRDAILLEVIASTRRELARVAESVLSAEMGALARLGQLAVELLRHTDQHPGLPRLLFANVASGAGPVLDALRHLYSMQRALVAELVREGQKDGEIDRELDAADASALFVGMLQSVTLMRRLEAGQSPLEHEGRRLLAIFVRGVAARDGAALSPVTLPASPKRSGLRALDVRPILARGEDPLDTILRELEQVGPCGVLSITAPFRPAPLIQLLTRRGHLVSDAPIGDGAFHVEVIVGGAPVPEDLRELEPPEPLERALGAAERLAPSGVYLARLPRVPRLLFPHLEERGLCHETHEEHDGTALLRVYRPA